MKFHLFTVFCIGLWIGAGSAALAQAPADSTGTSRPDSLNAAPPAATTTPQAAPATTPPPAAATASSTGPSKWYYGATLGFSLWGDVSRISIQPMVGYKVTPRLSVGGEVLYEHLKDTSGAVDYSYDNYGATVFSRFRLTQRLYAHAEFDEISYDFVGGREAVPFLYLGGGIVQSAGRRASLYVEVLVDVLQDDKSPYNDWEPQVSVGAAVGF